jgi:hypothetical protein
MISQKQLEANRRNALLSTGPRTAEGKGAVRLNALRHGLRAGSLLLPGENADKFQQLCDDLEAEWRPRGRTEQLLVEQMVLAQWKLARLEVGERSIFMQNMPAEKQMALLDRFSVQRSRLERSFSKAMRELQHLRNTRPNARAEEADEPAGDKPRPAATGEAAVAQPSYVMAPASAIPAT